MGIPAFYRWLCNTFPDAVVDVTEDPPTFINGVKVPVDTTRPNPNGMEFDNLYLDMNNIIHPCFHPENLASPESYDQVFKSVFKYVDRIFSLIRPRKLLYMAIDGVAPRAKMNQQRARRFRTAKDAADEASITDKLRGSCTKEGTSRGTEGLDSNVITPGTEFMELLSSALRYYINLRMNHDPGWQGIEVILSDASVPVEGEHKIMSYIRLQRNIPGFDPNTRHCLYGLDADLIMLGLAAHEVHFSILREVSRKHKDPKRKNKAEVHNLKQRAGPYRQLESHLARQKFQLFNLWILREGLAEHLKIPNPRVKVDTERLVDDFVLMCVFVGNDFIPHVPSLDISEGAISLLMRVYRKEFIRMGGYLTDSFEVNLERLEHFLQVIASREVSTFRMRRKKQRTSEMGDGTGLVPDNHSSEKESVISSNHVASEARILDKVKLGEVGWKERYYNEKFEVQTAEDRESVTKHAVLKYVEGISWVMHYYYEGVCSWQWFYPYHYAPFASDFRSLGQLKIHFSLGKPFKPFSQLMGVLPAASGQALPLFYRKLMIDPSSPILDFYPTDFELELNVGKPAWQAICKLPFIDECRLLNEISKVQHTLTDEEKWRNTLGLDRLFVHESHPLAAKISAFSERNKNNPKLNKVKVKRKINPKSSSGMNGYIYLCNKPICPAEISSPFCDMEMIMKNRVISVFYKFPTFHPHIARLPEGVTMPEMSISRHELLLPSFIRRKRKAIDHRRFARRPSPPPPPLEGRSTVAISAQPLDAESALASSHPFVAGPSPSNVLSRPLPPTPPLRATVRPMMAISYQYLVAESASASSQTSVAVSSRADAHSLVAGSSSASTHGDSRKPKRSRSQKRRAQRKRRKLNAIASQQIICPV
ncbi:5'-3' exoribonuclease 3-like isoform X2 [Primulina tabacum]|uniref:5'-3' exoribonuclease 3-like isoform X2 n=1 Tax=Primulina tabacum TaxID=48773 RepID=UPI003F5AD8F3